MCNNLYVERQVGGNCRLHALNGYFGYSRISISEWASLMSEYDEMLKTRYHTDVSCKSFDAIQSGGLTIISWVLLRYGIYTKYIPFNATTVDIMDYTWLFIFNHNHIWGLKKCIHGQWYTIDSLKGGAVLHSGGVLIPDNTGAIIPMRANIEYNKIGRSLSVLYSDANSICDHIKSLNECGGTLGDLEIQISNAMCCLEAQLNITNGCADYVDLRKLLNTWFEFLSIWTDGNYTNIQVLNKYIPVIILSIVKYTI